MNLESLDFKLSDAEMLIQTSKAKISKLDFKITLPDTTQNQKEKLWKEIETEQCILLNAQEEIKNIRLANNSNNK